MSSCLALTLLTWEPTVRMMAKAWTNSKIGWATDRTATDWSRWQASAASSNVCLSDDAAESFVVGVVVAPDDVPADHAGLLLVAGMVSAVQREVPQRRELRLDAV